VKAAAVKGGHLSHEKVQALREEDAVYLALQSGVSTSPIITDISGRGLGLAIVKEKIAKLGGSLRIESRSGQGTAFRFLLPTTLSRFRGLIVRVTEYQFVVPTSTVQRVVRVDTDAITTVGSRETIVLDNEAVSLVRLATVLDLPPAPAGRGEPTTPYAVVLANGHQRIAFLVDEVINEQEVLVKPLGKQLMRVRNISGATVLANGKVAPVLNVTDLMQSAVLGSDTRIRILSAPAEVPEARRKSVLVAEDSITSRILLKNILEAAGYEVETAVDGVDAFTKLRSGEFDLIVSDVEMPRLNGFDLTSKVRGERKFAELPVVLVTALNSREDQERGIDAGANAYIAKGSFDQNNLLQVIQRLI
jgi:two-component system chemotaxis sensor kinase CheA